MPAKPSALAPLLEKRRGERASQEQALARANASRNEAASAVARAEDALEQHRSARPELPPHSGEVSGLALQREAAFARRHVDLTERLARELAAAERSLAERQAQLEHAQLALARASADERAIERHEAGRAQARDKQREHREQEALDEQAAARIFARKGSGL
jgi:hypothetical protein